MHQYTIHLVYPFSTMFLLYFCYLYCVLIRMTMRSPGFILQTLPRTIVLFGPAFYITKRFFVLPRSSTFPCFNEYSIMRWHIFGFCVTMFVENQNSFLCVFFAKTLHHIEFWFSIFLYTTCNISIYVYKIISSVCSCSQEYDPTSVNIVIFMFITLRKSHTFIWATRIAVRCLVYSDCWRLTNPHWKVQFSENSHRTLHKIYKKMNSLKSLQQDMRCWLILRCGKVLESIEDAFL